MKKVVIVCLAACLLFVAGCGKKTPVSSSATQPTSSNAAKKSDIPTESAAESAAALAQRRSVALKALSDVMLNKAKFCYIKYYNINTGASIYLKNLSVDDTGANAEKGTYRMTSFQVLDVDGDGVPEVIVQAKLSSPIINDQQSMILRYCGGRVDGYLFQPVTNDLALGSGAFAKNGLCGTMDSARDNTVIKLRFLGVHLDTTKVMFSQANDNWNTISFYMYDVPVPPDLCSGQIDKAVGDSAPSHAFSEANIAKWITNRQASADQKPVIPNANLVARQNYLNGLSELSAFSAALPVMDSLTPERARTEYYQAWDKELNKIYGLLEKKLPTNQMDALRKDEQAWITVRDTNAAHVQEYQRGSYTYSVELDKYLTLGDVTKNRTLHLIDLYFGDTSQPSTTEIIQKYGLKK
ncbi:MAG: lysozyme inhibitor LprI family protein [Coriobacteriia bacterium]|nr:lysozyme inhibitor LprI family protein [Coriobacteriia bacterium]